MQEMTLRDYFAAAVLPSVWAELWSPELEDLDDVLIDWPNAVAAEAYRQADAMMKARKT